MNQGAGEKESNGVGYGRSKTAIWYNSGKRQKNDEYAAKKV